jgi:hypothetical protein
MEHKCQGLIVAEFGVGLTSNLEFALPSSVLSSGKDDGTQHGRQIIAPIQRAVEQDLKSGEQMGVEHNCRVQVRAHGGCIENTTMYTLSLQKTTTKLLHNVHI